MLYYSVSINGTYPNQKLVGFMLVSVPLNAQDESTAMGTFQVRSIPLLYLLGVNAIGFACTSLHYIGQHTHMCLNSSLDPNKT